MRTRNPIARVIRKLRPKRVESKKNYSRRALNKSLRKELNGRVAESG